MWLYWGYIKIYLNAGERLRLTFSSKVGFFTKTADLYLKHCFDSSYKYARWSGAKILFLKMSEESGTGIKTPKESGQNANMSAKSTRDWKITGNCGLDFNQGEKKLSELFLNPGTGCPHWISLSTHLFSVLTHNISRCRVKQEKNLPPHDFFF